MCYIAGRVAVQEFPLSIDYEDYTFQVTSAATLRALTFCVPKAAPTAVCSQGVGHSQRGDRR